MTCWLCGFGITELATNSKAPVCKNGPCQICIKVANIDGEINQAVAALHRLVARRLDLRSQQNLAHDLMHRLPVELKNCIFELVQLDGQDQWGNSVQRFQPRKVILPSICRSWRDIAWSNPWLWSKIRIKVERVSTSSQIRFVRDWILRSRALPLTFHIFVAIAGEELTGVLDAISECSNRWDSLSLDIPHRLLPDFHHSDFQFHRLRTLRIRSLRMPYEIDEHIPLLNQVNPENIEINGLSFQSLQISWNRLSSAKVEHSKEIGHLFQHAQQMTYCYITNLLCCPPNFPHIAHQNLKALTLSKCRYDLTLPSLRELSIDEMILLAPPYIPALVQRSSCPLTRITLFGDCITGLPGTFDYQDLKPLIGVTDLVLESVDRTYVVKFRLLDGYFPDLRHLTLRLEPFLVLWDRGIISSLLDRKRSLPGTGIFRILVVDPGRAPKFHAMWNSDVGKELKTLNIIFREDGFEFL